MCIEKTFVRDALLSRGDALDSPLYINAFLGSSKAPTPTEMERSVICAKPKDGANNETDSEATCCPDALSLQGFK